MAAYSPLVERPIKDTILLFDVDGTLTPARRQITPEMLAFLFTLRQHVAIGFVGGSDLPKAQEQLGAPDRHVTSMFDYSFPENGLTAFAGPDPLPSTSFIEWIGEDRYKKFANFVLHYIADLDIPVKRGTFIEFRRGMVNISPIGRNASIQERNDFEAYDKQHGVRPAFIDALRRQFPDLDVSYSIGGQISFDVFPRGWDKTYCLRHLENEAAKPDGVRFSKIHFYGDKTFQGGNDYEIFADERTIGHTVMGPEDTLRQVKEEFGL